MAETIGCGSRSGRSSLLFRVARWYIFKPKLQIWVNIGGSCNEKCWYIV
jgi:hypothetical protein